MSASYNVVPLSLPDESELAEALGTVPVEAEPADGFWAYEVGDDTGARLSLVINAFARSLSSARSYLIGLFFDDPASGYAVAMQRGALDRCRERHYHLVVERLDCEQPGWRDDLDAGLSRVT